LLFGLKMSHIENHPDQSGIFEYNTIEGKIRFLTTWVNSNYSLFLFSFFFYFKTYD
jgi:hypothetical protein